MPLSNLKHKNSYIYLLTIASVILILLTVLLGALYRGRDIIIAGVPFPSSSVSGSVQAVTFVFCILMVFIDYKKGSKRGYICLTLSLIFCLLSMVGARSLSSMPGAINCLLQILSIFLISRQFEYSDKAAITDRATGLLNRYGFERVLNRRVWMHESGYLVYMHIDGILAANSKYGRGYGDELLSVMSKRIDDVVSDKGTTFKIEGAEFIVLLNEKCEISKVLDALVATIEDRVDVNYNGNSLSCYLNANIGVAENIVSACDAKSLMMRADTAMNYAIKSPLDKVCYYNEEIKAKFERGIELENLIKEALRSGYFYLVYQPQFYTKSSKLRGFETLLRMRLPDGTNVSPGEFIPVAENSNLCLSIDEYVMNRALSEFKGHCISDKDSITISVNVSARGISMPGFADMVKRVLEKTNFPAQCLEIEMTEYSLVDSFEQTMENINILKEMDVKFALDDFGSGYSSLAEVLKLPIDLIKIDKSLIDNIRNDETNSDFVKTVIYLGHLMKCEVIAEGVELEEQLSLLKDYECDLIQGFIWGRPTEYKDALRLSNNV